MSHCQALTAERCAGKPEGLQECSKDGFLTCCCAIRSVSYTAEQLREVFLSLGFQLEAVMMLAQIQQDLVGTWKTCTKVHLLLLGILLPLCAQTLCRTLCVSKSSLQSCKHESGCFQHYFQGFINNPHWFFSAWLCQTISTVLSVVSQHLTCYSPRPCDTEDTNSKHGS